MGLCGKPASAHALGGSGGLVGRTTVRGHTDRLEPGGLCLLGVRVLCHSHASSLGLYHRLMDALGLGTDVVASHVTQKDSGLEAVSLEPGPGAASLARSLPDRFSDSGGHRPDGGLVRARAMDLWRMGRGENIRYYFRPRNEAGSGDRRLPDCGFSTGSASTLADGSPGSLGRGSARLRVSFRIRRHALASGQLHRAGVVSSLAPLAPTGLGPVSYHARGAAELRGVSAVLPGNPGCPPRVPPRSLGPDPGSCRGHDPRPQFWPILSGFPALDQRTGILLLSGPRDGAWQPPWPCRSWRERGWIAVSTGRGRDDPWYG